MRSLTLIAIDGSCVDMLHVIYCKHNGVDSSCVRVVSVLAQVCSCTSGRCHSVRRVWIGNSHRKVRVLLRVLLCVCSSFAIILFMSFVVVS